MGIANRAWRLRRPEIEAEFRERGLELDVVPTAINKLADRHGFPRVFEEGDLLWPTA